MTKFQALHWQRNIYLQGFTGKKPLISPDWVKLEQDAIAKMSKEAASYTVGEADVFKALALGANTVGLGRPTFMVWH